MDIYYTIKRLKDDKKKIDEAELKNFFYSGHNIDLIVSNEQMDAVDIKIIKLIRSAGDEVMFGPAFDLQGSQLQIKPVHNMGGEKGFEKDSLGVYLRAKPLVETKTLHAALMSAKFACIPSYDIIKAEDYLVKKINDYFNNGQ